MNTSRHPALLPVCALVLGTLVGLRLPPLGLWVPLLLAVLGVALGRRWGWCVCAAALGLLNVQLQPPVDGPGVQMILRRPVALLGRVESHPVCEPREGCRLRLGVELLVQGVLEERAEFPVWVALPAGLAPPIFGSQLRVRGYLRRRGADGNEPSSEPGSWRLHLKSGRFLSVEREAPFWWKVVDEVRGRLAGALWSGGEGRAAPLVGALILGDRSRLPKSWQQALKRCGLAHLLAVSGLHVGLVALLAFVPGLPWPLRLRCLLGGLLVLAYLLLLGPRPSVLRATAMALLALLALALERPPQPANALACGVAALLFWEPALVDDLGFRLSVAATAGILMLVPRWEPHLGWLPRAFRRPLAASLAAQLATLPFLWHLEGGLHPLALIFNLLALPWLALFLVLSFGWLVAALFAPAVATALLSLLDLLASPVEALAALPPSPWLLLPGSPPQALPWILLALALAHAKWWPVEFESEFKVRWSVVLGGASVLALLGMIVLGMTMLGMMVVGKREIAEDPGVEVLMLDVGQGDALVLRDGEEALLIDGGGWPAGDLGGRRLVPVLVTAGIHRLKAAVLTHPDLDHCGGLVDVARYLVMEEVWSAPFAGRSPCGAELLASPGTRSRTLWRGDELSLGRFRLRVLHPSAASPRRGEKVAGNDRSLVLMVEVFGRRLIFTGDLEAAAERQILRRFRRGLDADVLKVAHHGSRSSTTTAFLRAVAPRLALVSAGANNPYGHPAKDVLARLQGAGAHVLRTDLHGMVRLKVSPAGALSWTTVKAPVASLEGAGTP